MIKQFKLKDMAGGWFVGDFAPAALDTSAVEVAVQHFKAGEHSTAHHHKIATEVTLLLSGLAVMAGRTLEPGDIVTLPPGVSSSFEAISDCVTVVVKHPGVLNDKYIDE
ncbi:cupin domain-containing protein [Enterobacter sp. J49]|uniref:cupin domain-containing protein n=1 Tax=Enterobacter sp. J49 TaxID=1903627 RepID=UPI00211AFAD4|nr:cupin domain-containing protein [Enterobacter sp. J49]